MGIRGARPKPAELHVIGRDVGHAADISKRQPLNAALSGAYLTANDVPEILDEDQRAVWLMYFPPNFLRAHERSLYTEWALAVNELEIAEQRIREEGMVFVVEGETKTITRPNGNVVTRTKPATQKINQWLAVRDRAFLRMMKAISDLGFSPVSRARAPKGSSKAGDSGAQGQASSRFSKNAQTAAVSTTPKRSA